MANVSSDKFSRANIPFADLFVSTFRDNGFAIGMDGERRGIIRQLVDTQHLVASGRVPNSQRAVVGERCQQSTVIRKCDTANTRLMSVKLAKQLAAVCVEETNQSTGAADRQLPAIR